MVSGIIIYNQNILNAEAFCLLYDNTLLQCPNIALIKISLNLMYSKVCICKHLSDAFCTQNCLKQGNAISPFLFNFAIECTIRKVQENGGALELDAEHISF
jgi:hypothetical protein